MEVLIFLAVLLVCESTGMIVNSEPDFDEMLAKCCPIGNEWSESTNGCFWYNTPLPGIADEHRSMCLSIANICCNTRNDRRSCKFGLDVARNKRNCLHNTPVIYTSSFYDCCNACQLGLKVRSMNMSCDLSSSGFKFDWPRNESFMSCCRDSSKDKFGRKIETGTCKYNKCHQLCVQTSEAIYTCQCYSGYSLMADGLSCGDVNECDTNAHNCDLDTHDCVNVVGTFRCQLKSPADRSCRPGYENNKSLGICVDVDECEKRFDTCNKANEDCVNIEGGYKCRLKKQSLQLCPPGYYYNSATFLCEDIDECVQGIDACQKPLQVCVNRNGGYTCRSQSIRCPPGYVFNPLYSRCMVRM